MKIEHTQGPWQVRYSLANKNLASVTARNREPIAPCVGENAEANARLIAAAPDLLAALKSITDYDEGSSEEGTYGSEVMERCRAAISKAEGNA